jgi:TolB-like protein/tetratricopeptide (TPR) repeat protein
MTPERWHKVKKIFQAALDRAPEERSAFVSGACAGDELLRQEVESLLAAHAKDGSFIDSPAYRTMETLTRYGDLEPGQKVGHYEILATLGKGGMGEVYLAKDLKLTRQVALKVLPSLKLGAAHAGKRLLREARAAAALDHPNICGIYEISEADGMSYIAMQYLDGETLETRIANGSLSFDEALDIGVQIADGLAEAHAHDLVHRDIKPANIVITSRGQAKILDFGLAKNTERTIDGAAAETKTMLSTPGMILGTAPYMSPEQVRGERLDARTDIFSFGVVLYEMFCGDNPFAKSSTAETIGAILYENAQFATIDPRLPERIEEVIGRCLIKEREKRYQSMSEVASDLKALRETGGKTADVMTAALPSSRLGQPVSRDSANATPWRVKREQHRAWWWVGSLAAIVLLALTGLFLWSRMRSNASARTLVIDSLAVLPLVNSTGDPSKDYLADGISESLIGSLSQLSDVKVISRNSSFTFKGKETDAQKIAKQLGVRGIIAGTLRQVGDDFDVYIELIDALDGRTVFTQTYTRKTSDLVAMQSSIAQDVVTKTRVKLSPQEAERIAKLPTSNNEAYQLFLKGKSSEASQTADGLHQAIKYYQQAVERDPNFALAYAMIGQCYVDLGAYFEAPKDTMPQARAYAEKAVQLDNSLSDAHATLGAVHLLYDWDYDAAQREMSLSGQFNPKALETFSCAAHILESTGRSTEAERQIRNALVSDPMSTALRAELGCTSYYARQYDSAIAEERAAIAVDPLDPVARWNLARALDQKKSYQESIDELIKYEGISNSNDPLILSEMAYAYAGAGKTEEARTILRRLGEMGSHAFVDPYLIATIYAGLGDKSQTLAWLDKSYDSRSSFLSSANAEPKFDLLRNDPRFINLLKRVGFQV